ncbi:MAG: phosphodiester glycosidase family protein, partial [Bacteroidales bacterium]
LGFCSSGVPYLGQMGYNGYVKRKYRKETLHNINTARGADKLILYTPLIGKTTRTNGYGTEVVLMMKDGFEWSTNKEMTCIVRKINRKSGNTAVLPDELVLSGHGVSEEFLNTFQPGEEIKIRINISIEGHSGVAPDFREMLGSNTLVLENGEPVAVTSTAGDPKGRHPRTLAGYSADKTKFYMCVIDGRTAVSAGISQADAAAIMKDAGAYTAINFDGGGSSILAVEGVPFNNPAGGKPYRLVSDALLLVQHQDVSSARPVQSIQPSIQIVKQNLEKRFRITGVEEGAIKQVNIYSLTGNCLLTLDSTAWFDLSNYPGGVYLVEVILKNNVKYIRKIPC